MVGVTKRRVQAGQRGDFEGASSKATRLEESTGDVQRKLHRHFNETAFMQRQWRGSLSRVSLALSAVLAYRLFYLWSERTSAASSSDQAASGFLDDQPSRSSSSNSSTDRTALAFLLGQHAVETLGVPLGLCIAHFVTAAAPSVLAAPSDQQLPQGGKASAHHHHQQQQHPPASFYAAALLSALELLAFARTVQTAPGGYALHIDATFPVGAVLFLVVWACDRLMRRGLDDAKVGLEASRRLSQAVGRAKAD